MSAYSESKALEITTEFVKATLQNSSVQIDNIGGADVSNFFKAIYEGIQPVIENSCE